MSEPLASYSPGRHELLGGTLLFVAYPWRVLSHEFAQGIAILYSYRGELVLQATYLNDGTTQHDWRPAGTHSWSRITEFPFTL